MTLNEQASEIQLSTPTSTTFNLHINPYFLRLTFPHPVVDVDSIDPSNASSANYDPSGGTLTVTLCKAIPGSDFGDLSMISRLMAVDHSLKKDHSPTIEVLDSKEDGKEDDDSNTSEVQSGLNKDIMEPLRTEMGKLDLERERAVLLEGKLVGRLLLPSSNCFTAEKNNWILPLNPDKMPEPSLDTTFTTSTSPFRPYGFLDMYTGYFRHASSAYSDNEGNELGPDIEILAPVKRRALGKKKVDTKFDGSYYL